MHHGGPGQPGHWHCVAPPPPSATDGSVSATPGAGTATSDTTDTTDQRGDAGHHHGDDRRFGVRRRTPTTEPTDEHDDHRQLGDGRRRRHDG